MAKAELRDRGRGDWLVIDDFLVVSLSKLTLVQSRHIVVSLGLVTITSTNFQSLFQSR